MKHLALQVFCAEHSTIRAVLDSVLRMTERGPGDTPERFFDLMRAMLFYVDEFPGQRHHPRESELLFPKLGRAAPETLPLIRRLESEHMQGEVRVRELQHMLLAWELLGDMRREAFALAAHSYVRFYEEHMRLEESGIFPVADTVLGKKDWLELDAASRRDRDPLAGGPHGPCYDRLFTRIVTCAPRAAGMRAA